MPPTLTPEQISKYGFTPLPRSFSTLLSSVDTTKSTPANPNPTIPDTDLARRIHAYAQKELPTQTFNHSMRVYQYGSVIISQHFPQHAAMLETYFLACMMHDIGTTDKNLHATAMSFEFYGGYLAREVCLQNGAPREQAESVAEAVIRHQDLGETGTVQAVEAVLMLATVFDNVGMHPDLVHRETIEAVTKAFPRQKWSGCFASTIRQEMDLKPWAHTSHIERFAEQVEGNKLMEPYE